MLIIVKKKNKIQKKLSENNNIEMIRRSQIQSKKSTRFNTPIKLKITNDFDLPNNNTSEILFSSNKKKDIIITDRNVKKNVNKAKNIHK